MPEMNGFEVCRHIKENEISGDIQVIFITALSDTKNIVKPFEAGGVDYITKPFVKEEVQARMQVHLATLKKAMERMTNMAVTDAMTGIYNRRYAHKVLTREMNISRREGTCVFCFVDIDNLKKINDTFGHDAGAQLITEVVNGFKSVIRITDYLFYMGG